MSSLSNGCFPKDRMIFCYRGFFPSTTYRRHQPLFASPPARGPEGGCPDTDPCPVGSPGQRRYPATKRKLRPQGSDKASSHMAWLNYAANMIKLPGARFVHGAATSQPNTRIAYDIEAGKFEYPLQPTELLKPSLAFDAIYRRFC